MSGKVLNKMMGFLGLEDDVEEIEEMDNEEINTEMEEKFISSKKKNKVVSIHSASTAKVIIIKPKEYDDVTDVSDHFKSRKIVVVNTSELDTKVAQRVLDFMSGASYALDGELQQIEKGVYILAPSNIEVTNELKSELSSKGLFAWNK